MTTFDSVFITAFVAFAGVFLTLAFTALKEKKKTLKLVALIIFILLGLLVITAKVFGFESSLFGIAEKGDDILGDGDSSSDKSGEQGTNQITPPEPPPEPPIDQPPEQLPEPPIDLGRSTCLTDLKPFGNTSVETHLPSQIDNYGNSYTKILSCNNGYGEYNEVEYSLGGNYGSFTGTIFVTKDSVESVGSFDSFKPEIRIYGDNVLLYTKKGCNYKDKPLEFLVNIKNVNYLKIVFDGAYYSEDWGWMRPLLVIGEPTLWENVGEETPSPYKGKQGIRTRLKELKPFGDTKVTTEQPVQYTTDNYGNSYNYVLSCNGSYATCDEVEYYLGEKYTELTGTFYVTQGSVENEGDFEFDLPEIRFYGDEKLLYTKTGCTSKDAPEEFTIDLSGVEFLKVVFDGTYYSEPPGWMRPLLVIGEPVLWEAVE